MLSIKITPMFLFLILLIVLVISVIFGNRLLKEGFVSFQKDKTYLNYVNIPSYSKTKTVPKLYDNLYFDNNNGNLIEVDSTKFDKGDIDTIGNTIASTIVTTRLGWSKVYNTNLIDGKIQSRDTDESLIKELRSNYVSLKYESKSSNTDNYCVFYIPWYKSTYIHVINKTAKTNIATYYFDNNGDNQYYSYDGTPSSSIGITYNQFTSVSGTNKELLYDSSANLYQIGKYVKYDILNGNLILQKDEADTNITVYKRNGTKVENITSSNKFKIDTTVVSNLSFTPQVITDTVGKNIILYLPYKTNTVVALFGLDGSNSSSYKLNNVMRFTSTDVDYGDDNNRGGSNRGGSNRGGSNSGNSISDYYKWYWYWNMTGGESNNLNYSDDYLLKTQIVPPVCPACNSCNGSTCTNCGGQGGSGTLSNNGNSVVNNSNNSLLPASGSAPPQNQTKAPNDNVSIIGNGGFVSNADPNTIGGSLTLTTYDTVAGIEGVAQTGANVLNTATGTVGSVANSAIGAVSNVASDVTGLIGGAGSGVKDLLTQGNQGKDNTTTLGPDGKPITINRTEGAFKSPYGTSTIDQYSYYGTLPNKGNSNFMPLTADFSAFGR